MRTRAAERPSPQDDRTADADVVAAGAVGAVGADAGSIATAGAAGDPHRFGRGQMMVIFAGAMVTLMLLMAMVVDVGWYWSSGLRIQRAADAAALAGAVYLPDNFNGATPNAQSAALAAAARNGFVPDADTSLTSAIDDNNPRQLDVTINDQVGTFFLKVVGIKTLAASRSSKAEFVLPVPMGSPQNYYGVGTFVASIAPAPTSVDNPFVNPFGYLASTPTTGAAPTAFTAGGSWTNSGNVYTSNNIYATTATNNAATAYKTFTFGSFQGGATIDGLVVNMEAKVSAANANCKVKMEVSWNGGFTWGSAPQTSNALTTLDAWHLFGSTSNAAIWGANHSTWATTDFTTPNNFQVRMTYSKTGTCSGTASVDEITAVVYSHTTTVTTYPRADTVQTVTSPTPPGTTLTSQGFWGATITKGGSRDNGDQFDPAYDYAKGVANPDYDGKGVDYTVLITGANGQVQLFDPTFCETGSEGPGKGNYGAGDHYIGSIGPVTTVYTLLDQNGTPYDPSDDITVATSGNLFAGEKQGDYSGDFGSPNGGLGDCQNGTYHNAWYQLASGLPAGDYRLNVSTNFAGNSGTNAENMWSAWVSSGSGNPRVYGQGKMVAYNNLASGTQLFYLAQIDKVHAGKTMEIKLFDPGDVGGNASLKIQSPDGNTYKYVNFTWTADNGKTGAGNFITTAVAGNNLFQDSVITIQIPLPLAYGGVGLTPPSETAFGPGWWKIEYTVDGGNDTTSWQVDITGNPVHLLVP